MITCPRCKSAKYFDSSAMVCDACDWEDNDARNQRDLDRDYLRICHELGIEPDARIVSRLAEEPAAL